jgi:hypothetical protein
MRLLEEIKNEEQPSPSTGRIVMDHPEFTVQHEGLKDSIHNNNHSEEKTPAPSLISSSETRKQVNSLLSSLSTELQRLQLYRTIYESSGRPSTSTEQQMKQQEKAYNDDDDDDRDDDNLKNKENPLQGLLQQGREKETDESNRPFSPSDFVSIPAFLKIPDSLTGSEPQPAYHQKQQQRQQHQNKPVDKQISFPPRRSIEADSDDNSSPRFFLPPIRLGSSQQQQQQYDYEKPSSTSSSVFGSAREMLNSRGKLDSDIPSSSIDSSNPYAVGRRRVKQPKPAKPSGISSIHRSPRRSTVQSRPDTGKEDEDDQQEEYEYEYDVRKSYEGDEIAYDVDEGEGEGFAIRAMYDDEDDDEEAGETENLRYSKASYESLLKEKKKLELLQKVREFVEI